MQEMHETKEEIKPRTRSPRTRKTSVQKNDGADKLQDVQVGETVPLLTVGGIIQITAEGHPYRARIGIIHEFMGDNLICYQPGKNGFPHKFKVAIPDVSLVGTARLKYNRALPDEPTETKNRLDKI